MPLISCPIFSLFCKLAALIRHRMSLFGEDDKIKHVSFQQKYFPSCFPGSPSGSCLSDVSVHFVFVLFQELKPPQFQTACVIWLRLWMPGR